jgi:hypothetical protein
VAPRENMQTLQTKKCPLRESFFQIGRPPLLLEGNGARLTDRSLCPRRSFTCRLASLHLMCFLPPPIGLCWYFVCRLSSLHLVAHASLLPSAGGHLCCLLISLRQSAPLRCTLLASTHPSRKDWWPWTQEAAVMAFLEERMVQELIACHIILNKQN